VGKISATFPIPENMEKIIKFHTVGLGVVGVGGGLLGPGADLPVIAASWVAMTLDLGGAAGLTLKEQAVKKICLAVSTGAGAFLAGTKIAATAAGWITAWFTAGASLVISAAGNAALNAAFTRAYGRACARYFLQADEIDDFEVVVQVLITLIGAEMGIKMGSSDLIA
jgi:hypothetical protein